MSAKIRENQRYRSMPTIGKRTMNVQHRKEAEMAIMLINHHREIAANIEKNLATMLTEMYQVDIATGNWNINFGTGEITQVAGKPE